MARDFFLVCYTNGSEDNNLCTINGFHALSYKNGKFLFPISTKEEVKTTLWSTSPNKITGLDGILASILSTTLEHV